LETASTAGGGSRSGSGSGRAQRLAEEVGAGLLQLSIAEDGRLAIAGDETGANSANDPDAVTVASLRSFRPKLTILEMDGSKQKREHGSAIMRAARHRHERKDDLWEHGNAMAAERKAARLAAESKETEKDHAGDEVGKSGEATDDDSDDHVSHTATRGTESTVACRIALERPPRVIRRVSKRAGAKGIPGTLTKAARRKAARNAAVQLQSISGRGTQLTTGAFRDSGLFIQQGPDEAERRETAALQVHGLANSETATRGGAAAGLDGITRLDSSVVDVVADDQRDMADKKRRLHWDKRKRKYVRITDSEASDRRGDKRMKTESGAVVRSDGKDHGYMYRRWTKETKRTIGDGVAEDGGGGGQRGATDWRNKGRGRHNPVPLAAQAGRIAPRRPSGPVQFDDPGTSGGGQGNRKGRNGKDGRGGQGKRGSDSGLALDEAGVRRAHAKKSASRKHY